MFIISMDPIVTIGPISVRWYGIMVALAVLTVVLWTLWQAKKDERISYDTALTAALVGIPSGIIFAKVLHVIDLWQYYIQHPGQIFNGAGLTIYGAVLGAALGIWIFSKVNKFQFSHFADMIAPGIILSQAVGRIGCTINGCCYGLQTSSPCGVIYTHPNSLAPLGVAVLPTQIYEIIYNLIVFGILLILRKRLKPDGSLFLIYLSLYSLWRLGIGFLRDGTPFLLGLHQAQVIGIIILAIAIPILVLKTRWVRKEKTRA